MVAWLGFRKTLQKAFFEKYIEKIKKDDEATAQLRLNQLAFGNNNTSLASANQGKWYFYNTQSTSFGATEFRKIWGNRPLSDNWRLGDKSQLSLENTQGIDQNMANSNREVLELSYYLEKIPSEKVKIDSIASERNTAYFKLGIISLASPTIICTLF